MSPRIHNRRVLKLCGVHGAVVQLDKLLEYAAVDPMHRRLRVTMQIILEGNRKHRYSETTFN
jgi:hypothetical protein